MATKKKISSYGEVFPIDFDLRNTTIDTIKEN